MTKTEQMLLNVLALLAWCGGCFLLGLRFDWQIGLGVWLIIFGIWCVLH